jgi:hypothetical protein
MKTGWWLFGTIAAVTGGVLLLKHLIDSQKNLLHFVESGSEKNFGEFPPEIPESEFDGIDFLT